MTYSAFAFYGSFGVMVCALVPISLSRVVALTKSHLSRWLFSGRRSLVVCVLFDLVPIAILFVSFNCTLAEYDTVANEDIQK
ncbi:hypothetical protein OESDEN_14351 [Oesophagostomum dentatum]|uniref:Uncharacterized protein n=1 Tax=Oesophagostomum dentatum TaxID=61180 RepID=A0A0B1SKQ1_OESDE|nr:hypothetical protein OESDEN_14351 [Oesophagostomum dentatum]